MQYTILKGGHADLKRIYPMMEFSTEKKLLVSESRLHKALHNGAQILLLKDEGNYEAGFAFVLRKHLCPYYMIAWHGIYPVAEDTLTKTLISLVMEYYSEKGRAALMAVPKNSARTSAVATKNALLELSFSEVNCDLEIAGTPHELYCSNETAKGLVESVPNTVLTQLYTTMMSRSVYEKMFRADVKRMQV